MRREGGKFFLFMASILSSGQLLETCFMCIVCCPSLREERGFPSSLSCIMLSCANLCVSSIVTAFMRRMYVFA